MTEIFDTPQLDKYVDVFVTYTYIFATFVSNKD